MSKEPATIETLDADGLKIADYVNDIKGHDFVHVKTGNVYTVHAVIWDADTDQWAVLYMRKDGKGVSYKRLLKNFYWVEKDVPRFVKLNYGESKPVTRGIVFSCGGGGGVAV